jgi:hypothetical protein
MKDQEIHSALGNSAQDGIDYVNLNGSGYDSVTNVFVVASLGRMARMLVRV